MKSFTSLVQLVSKRNVLEQIRYASQALPQFSSVRSSFPYYYFVDNKVAFILPNLIFIVKLLFYTCLRRYKFKYVINFNAFPLPLFLP